MIQLPQSPAAYLFDLDGVLVDSLQLDIDICTPILQKFYPDQSVSADLIKKNFAFEFPKFWRNILTEMGIEVTDELLNHCVTENERLRDITPMKLHPGVLELLEKNQEEVIPQVVVSNNSEKHIITLLKNSNILDYFVHIVGNDEHRIKHKKPAPDCYLLAAEEIGVDIKECIIVEDSDAGVQAGKAAGGFVVGVATGGGTSASLEKNGADLVVSDLTHIL